MEVWTYVVVHDEAPPDDLPLRNQVVEAMESVYALRTGGVPPTDYEGTLQQSPLGHHFYQKYVTV